MAPAARVHGKLMRAIASGDSAAFSRLYDILSVATYTVFRRHLPDQAEVDQAMHDVWVSVWQNAQAVNRQPGTPSEKIIAIAERCARSRAAARL
jgi:DNA-directed RNA polymerase specialized sigma24 family protein